MKPENEKLKIPAVAANILLITCAVFSALGIIITAFDFDVNMSVLFYVILPGSAAVVILTLLLRWRGIMIMSAPVFIILIWNLTRIADDFRWVVFSITSKFSVWTPVPAVFPEVSEYAQPPVYFFVLLALSLVLLLYITICLRHSTALTILSTLPLAFLSFVLTDTPPDVPYVLCLLAVYSVMLLSGALQPDDFEKSIKTFAVSLLISVTFIAAVYTIASPSRFAEAQRIRDVRSYVLSLAEQIAEKIWQTETEQRGSVFSWPGPPDIEIWRFNTNNVNIADAGQRFITGKELLEITASEPGTFYIRGFNMGDFDGRAWTDDISIRTEEYVPGYSHPAVRYEVKLNPNLPAEAISLELPANLALSRLINNSAEQENGSIDIPRYAGMNLSRINDITRADYRPYYYIDDYNITDELIRESNYEIYDDILGNLTGYYMRFFHVPGSVRDFADEVYVQYFTDLADIPAMLAADKAFVEIIIEDRVDFIQMDTGELQRMVQEKIEELKESSLQEYISYEAMYTNIDETTAVGLRRLAEDAGIDSGADREAVADAVSAYVRSSGTYTLTPGVIPEGEDFALYFLQTSREGYCIHFATAATLMLRALDVPARFTTGYVARVSRDNAGEPVILTDASAHAWVEVLYDDTGWLPLEVTPSGAGSYIPEPQRHTPPDRQPDREPESSQNSPAGVNTPPPRGQGGAGSGEGAGNPFRVKWIVQSLVLIASILVSVTAVRLRRVIICRVRERCFSGEDTNEAVIFMWKHVLKVLGSQGLPPGDIEELALKARFSQHKITEDERSYMLKYTHRLTLEVYEGSSDLMRLWLKYGRVI